MKILLREKGIEDTDLYADSFFNETHIGFCNPLSHFSYNSVNPYRVEKQDMQNMLLFYSTKQIKEHENDRVN